MIYFIEHPKDKQIKIGTTIKLSQRLGTLACEYGQGLTVLAVRDGGRDEEQALHKRFEHLNAEGEWFTPGPDLLAFIKDECREWDGKDEVPAGKLIRVSDEFAEAIRGLSVFEKSKIADMADLHLLPIVEKRYRDAVFREAAKYKEQDMEEVEEYSDV